MASFLLTVSSNHTDNEFGLEYIQHHLLSGLRYEVMVFQNPDARTLNVWEPSLDDWAIVITT